MISTRPCAPAVALFGAIISDQRVALAGACAADARQEALAQAATVSRVRALYGMGFATSIN
ncbi:hypothetical protein BH10PSE13_BH10PSE13_21480 [soil metagenome]